MLLATAHWPSPSAVCTFLVLLNLSVPSLNPSTFLLCYPKSSAADLPHFRLTSWEALLQTVAKESFLKYWKPFKGC